MFINPFPDAFGIDISDLSIKAVQLKKQMNFGKFPTYKILSARSVTLPQGLIVNGVLQEPEKVRKYIEHLLRGGKTQKHKNVKSPWVVASIPEIHTFIKQIEIAKPAEDIIEEDVFFAIKNHFPIEENEIFLDWQILPQENEKNSLVLVSTAQKDIVNMYTYLLESVGLAVIALEPESLSLARTLVTQNKEYVNEARALLDIGATHSNLIVYDNNSVQFSKVLSFSGEIINTALAQKLKITRDQAENMKYEIGFQISGKDKKAIQAILTTLPILGNELAQAIRFYYTHFPNAHKITHITMCGGGAYLKNLPEILTEKLGIESLPGHVWKNLNITDSKKLPENEALSYAVAIGLGLRAANHPYVQHKKK